MCRFDLFFGAFSACTVLLVRGCLFLGRVCPGSGSWSQKDRRDVGGLDVVDSEARGPEVAVVPRATASRRLAGGTTVSDGSFAGPWVIIEV